jgi:hypothetical protein
MGDKDGLKRILNRSPEGRKRRGRPEMKWEREVKRVMKQKNVTPEGTVNRPIWRKATEYQSPV